MATGLIATAFSVDARASSPACLVGCVKADTKGLKDLADALKEWARMLPQLNEQFHAEIRKDLVAMDVIAVNLVNQIERSYGRNVDVTGDAIRSLMQDAVKRINEIGNNALVTYRNFLYETDCGVHSVSGIIGRNLNEYIPRFQWIREIFGTKFNVIETTGYDGRPIEETFDPDSSADRFWAAYRALSRKAESATEHTKMFSVMNISLERQLLAFQYHCETRSAIGTSDQFGHIFTLLRESRHQYVDLNYVYSFRP